MGHSESKPAAGAGDTALLARLRAGEQAAFEQLVRGNLPRMRAAVARIVGEGSADDVVQEAFLGAFKALSGFRGESAVSTWLHRIAINAALMHLRREKPRAAVSIDDLLPTFAADGTYSPKPTPWTHSAEELARRAETRAMVRGCIDALPDTHRLVLVLRDIEELSTREAADALGISEGACKVRLHRARQALRTLIDRELAGGAAAADGPADEPERADDLADREATT